MLAVNSQAGKRLNPLSLRWITPKGMTAVLRMLVKISIRSATRFQVLAFLLFIFIFETGFSQSAIHHGQQSAPLQAKPSAEFSHDFRGPWADVSFSPDGRSLASLGEMSNHTIWDVASGQPRHHLLESGALPALAFHPNNRWLAFVDMDNKTIHLWDATSASEVRRLRGHNAEVLALRFIDDGSQLVSMAFDGTLKLWDTDTGRELKSMQLERVAGAIFSQDGRLLVTKTLGEYTSKLWTVSNGRLLRVLPTSTNMDHVMALSADGTLLADAGDRYESAGSSPGLIETNAIRIYDVATGEERHRIPLTSKDYMLQSLAFSPDGRWLTLAGYSDVWLWEVNTGRQGFHVAFGSLQKAVTFSADGEWLVVSSDAGVTLFNIAVRQKLPDGNTVLALRTDDANGILALAFGSNDRRIATAGGDGLVRLWDVASKRVVRTLPGKLELAATVRFSHNGNLLGGYDFGNTITLWDAESGELLRKCKVSEQLGPGISAWGFSPDDRLLAVGERGKTVLFDVAACSVVRELAPVVDPNDPSKAPKPGFVFDQAGSLAFNPNGHLVAQVVGNSLQLWDVNTGQKLAELTAGPTGQAGYRLPAFSPDGRWLAVLRDRPNQHPPGPYDFQLVVYDATSLREKYAVLLPDRGYGLAFNASGDLLIDAYRLIEVREGATGKVLRSLPIPQSPPDMHVFSNNGRWLATVGGGDKAYNSISLWDLVTGEHAATLAGMPMRSFSWDENQLLQDLLKK
jgi:WD40 repeat protein